MWVLFQTQSLISQGDQDLNNTATVSMIFYYTDAFERVTPDIRGHIDGLGRVSIHFKNKVVL